MPQRVGCAATEPRSLLISNALRAELSAHGDMGADFNNLVTP